MQVLNTHSPTAGASSRHHSRPSIENDITLARVPRFMAHFLPSATLHFACARDSRPVATDQLTHQPAVLCTYTVPCVPNDPMAKTSYKRCTYFSVDVPSKAAMSPWTPSTVRWTDRATAPINLLYSNELCRFHSGRQWRFDGHVETISTGAFGHRTLIPKGSPSTSKACSRLCAQDCTPTLQQPPAASPSHQRTCVSLAHSPLHQGCESARYVLERDRQSRVGSDDGPATSPQVLQLCGRIAGSNSE